MRSEHRFPGVIDRHPSAKKHFSAKRNSAFMFEKDLNPQQLEVVTAGDGPILVIAGAGSGKTRAITYRVAYLVALGIPAHRIFLATFTNKAAREMLHRAEILIQRDITKMYGGTFHHIGNVLLRRHASALGYGENFTILDKEDCRDLIDVIIKERDCHKDKRFPKGDVLSAMFSLAVNTCRNLEDIIQVRYPFSLLFMDDILEIERRYHEKKKAMNSMDYDDLLSNLVRLLQDEKLKAYYSEYFLHVLVDEYQDTNKIQADLVDILCSHHKNLMVVGDDSQSIYSFRGANFENIIEFPSRYPDTKIIKLEINYRSTPDILRLANAVIVHNKRQYRKKLLAVKNQGLKPNLVPLYDTNQEARFTVQRVLELSEKGFSLSDMAVLYRSHYHSMELQVELTRRGIPFEVRSGIRFFEQRHIKDVIAHLKICFNPYDELSWKRIMKLLPKVGISTAHKVWLELSKSGDPLSHLKSEGVSKIVPKGAREAWGDFAALIETISRSPVSDSPSDQINRILLHGYRDYLHATFSNAVSREEDVEQLSTFASRFSTLEEVLSELSLLTNIEPETAFAVRQAGERLILSTVHQAKGLEWPVVFVISLADGRFPAAQSLKEASGEEEERRLFYVAVTRAKDELYLCYPYFGTGFDNKSIFFKPSRFIQEIEEDCVEKWTFEGREMTSLYPFDPRKEG
jgi:DNA helicase-2/ATP-dependent DNA helicase PcrA